MFHLLRFAIVAFACAVLPRCHSPRRVVTDPSAASEILVDLQSAVPGVIVDLQYSKSSNVFGEAFYKHSRAYLRKEAAERLSIAARRLQDYGYKLKVWDAYRPLSVQYQMWRAVADERYVANPEKGGRHNRGAAVDVTLTDFAGRELEMPTLFDNFTERARPGFDGAGPAAARNAALLANLMIDAGFSPLSTEWWHFDANGWEHFELLDIDPVELAAPAPTDGGIEKSAAKD